MLRSIQPRSIELSIIKMDEWLKGEPFLEVSFILPITGPKSNFLIGLIDKIKNLRYPVDFKEDNLDQVILSFGNDMPGFMKIPLVMQFPEERKSELCIEEIAIGKALQFTFFFYGGKEDIGDQMGIRNDEDLLKFTDLLRSLYSIFRFSLGFVAFETNCIEMIFSPDKTWPHDSYSPENIDFTRLFMNIRARPFIDLIYNSRFYPSNKLKFLFSEVGNEGIWVSRKWM